MKNRAPLYAGIAIVAVIAGFLSAQFIGSAPPPLQLNAGTLLPSTRALPDFTLQDQHAQPFTRQQLQGRWSIVFFGYTSCPDICPTTLTTLAQVARVLADVPLPQRPQVVFISVDPRRDTPAQVDSYLRFFNPEFIGLTGTTNAIAALTQAMGVPVDIRATGNGAYTVDHAATLFLLNPAAQMTAVFSPPHQVTALADDLRRAVTTLH